ncbi:MAG: hypothetical protein ILM98_08935 [Kiritimatiellae bacterium]|nr:hypothetical protein [Kiritimatiellia bacterium]
MLTACLLTACAPATRAPAACALAVQTASSAAALDATLSAGGVVHLDVGGREYRLEPLALLEDWTAANPLGGHEVAPTGTVEMVMTSGGRPILDVAVTLHQLAEGKVKLGCRFTPREDFATQALGWLLKLDAAEAEGREWRIGETRGFFAHAAADGVHLAEGCAASFAFDLGASGETLRLESWGVGQEQQADNSGGAIDCLVQDNQNWSDEYHVRLGALSARRLAKGETVAFSLILSLASGEPLAARNAEPFVIEAGEDWIPLDNRRDIVAGSALDFSAIVPHHSPAGKFGWLRNVGGHFEFESLPGKQQRFYGVNLCLTANYPDHATADALVTRLRRLGYNAVRIHHHDGIWKDAIVGRKVEKLKSRKVPQQSSSDLQPSTFQPFNSSMSSPQIGDDIDRLDYLLAKCFENGIYATTDLYVSRPVAWRDIGVEQDGDVDIHVFKMLCAIYEPAFENWAKFADDFLLHENPYTGRRYIDEPAMPLISLVNEGGFFVGWNSGGRDDPRVAAAWREWMSARRVANPSFAQDLTTNQTPRAFWWLDVHPAIAQWTGELEAKMVARMKTRLRSLGCKALLSNDNCGPHYAALQRATADLDYIDDHFYIDHPRFPETPWKLPSTCQNNNPLLGDGHLAPSEQAFTRMMDKPFTVSEWNFAAPSRFRSMGGFLAGAMAALQGWDGLWRFDYSYLDSELGDRGMRGPHYFDLATDPIGQASERAAICLFRRGDLAPLTNGVALWCTPESAFMPDKTFFGYPPWCDDAWTMRVGSCLSPDGAGGLVVLRREEAESGFAPGVSAPGLVNLRKTQISIDSERGTLAVVTSHTCGGFTPSGRLDAGPLSFEILSAVSRSFDSSKPVAGRAVPATVWISSLDGAPIERSSRLLLTHLTDVQGEGAKFADNSMTKLLALGGRPLVRVGAADVALRLVPRAGGVRGEDSPCPFPAEWRVWALDTAGRRICEVPATFSDGALRFRVSTNGPEGGRIYYEIFPASAP